MLLFFKQPVTPDLAFLDRTTFDEEKAFEGIRCPVCQWRPNAHDVWRCEWHGTPEPFFPSCGTIWNTFQTAGRCPGCDHQWAWTSCLRCNEASPHDDWYEDQA